MSWESPINVIYGEIETRFENDVLKAIQSCDIKVNKEELLKALNYDRDQYEKGEWDMFALITATYYGKQYYFDEGNGLAYSRKSGKKMLKQDAINEFLKTIGDWDEL